MTALTCKDCGSEVHLWSDGLHHWDRSLDFDHALRLDDGRPEDTRDLAGRTPEQRENERRSQAMAESMKHWGK